MANENLIAYLKAQKAEREQELVDYENAVEKCEAAKLAYEEAEKEVEKFGDVEKVKEDVAKIDGFIFDLEKVEDKTVEEATPESYEEQPAQPFVGQPTI